MNLVSPEQFRAAWRALEAHDFRQALSLFSAIVETKPESLDGWCGVSAAQLGVRNFSAALYAAEKAYSLAPKAAQPLFVLGPSALCIGDDVAVRNCFEALKKLDRKVAAGLARFWADRLSEHQRYDDAVKAYSAFIENFESDYDALSIYAELLLNAAQPEPAIACVDEALKSEPARAEAHALRARANLQLGALDDAKVDARTALRHNPDCLPAYMILAEIDAGGADPAMIDRLVELLGRGSVPVVNRVLAGYALGRIYEAQESYDDAFSAFAAANKMERDEAIQSGRRYNRAEAERAVRSEIETYSQEFFEAATRTPKHGQGLVFIVGMPRSGSTLVEQILTSHSMATGVGESGAFPELHQSIVNNALQMRAPVASVIEARADEWEAAYRRATMTGPPNLAIVIDKMLSNFWRVGLIARLFPAAKVLIMKRDPMDVGLSIFRLNFLGAHAYANDLEDIAHYHACFDALCRHWCAVAPSACKIVDYEELVGDFETGVRELLDFCGLQLEASCLEFHRSDRAVSTLSAAQVREPISPKSIGRWRKYEAHLEPLRRGLEISIPL